MAEWFVKSLVHPFLLLRVKLRVQDESSGAPLGAPLLYLTIGGLDELADEIVRLIFCIFACVLVSEEVQKCDLLPCRTHDEWRMGVTTRSATVILHACAKQLAPVRCTAWFGCLFINFFRTTNPKLRISVATTSSENRQDNCGDGNDYVYYDRRYVEPDDLVLWIDEDIPVPPHLSRVFFGVFAALDDCVCDFLPYVDGVLKLCSSTPTKCPANATIPMLRDVVLDQFGNFASLFFR